MLAYLLIKVAPKSERKVFEMIQRVRGIKETYSVYGKYDIVAKFETHNEAMMKKIYYEDVKTIREIQSCTICRVCKIGKF
jgi:DNA-binding Lrp family transcriptional regulator